MSDKQKNLIVRAITGIIFVAVMVLGILHPYSLIVLFAFITGAALWEYTGLVNNIKGVKVNRFISTIAGVYFFLSTAGLRLAPGEGFIVFIPYVLTIMYLFVAELYLKNENPVNSWAYTMLGQLYIALPFSLINILAFQQNEAGQTTFDFLLPLSVFIFLWTNDTGLTSAVRSSADTSSSRVSVRERAGKGASGAVSSYWSWQASSAILPIWVLPPYTGHSGMDRPGAGRRNLRYMGRPRRESLQTHTRH